MIIKKWGEDNGNQESKSNQDFRMKQCESNILRQTDKKQTLWKTKMCVKTVREDKGLMRNTIMRRKKRVIKGGNID